MDIRICNSMRQILNVSRMHIEVRGKYLVGLTESMKEEILIETYETEDEAAASLDEIKEGIRKAIKEGARNLIIKVGEEDGKRQDS